MEQQIGDTYDSVKTVFEEESFTKKEASGKYVCSACGYEYGL